jgi:N-acetyl sugar amidotransferase
MPRYCHHCILPETRPGVKLDERGICQGCANAVAKAAIDWPARAREFRSLAADVRRRSTAWDCVIPVSGGKDSFWQVVTCLEHGLNPLCVTYAVPGRNALGQANLRKLIDLGVDHIDFRPNPKAQAAFIGRAFRERGISGLVMHMAVFALPVRIAVAERIPLVVYGENSAFEYGSEDPTLAGADLDRRWLETFGVTDGTTAHDWVGDGITERDLIPYVFPDEAALAVAGTRIVFLGHYFPWDPENSRRIAMANGFRSLEGRALVGHYDYVNIDDDLIGVHHHAKWVKFGITRSWDTLSMEIRAGRMTREQAIEELRRLGDETPRDAIRAFCDYLAMSEREYFEVLERFRNREIWTRRGGRWVIDDFLIDDFDWPSDPAVLAA